MGNALRYLKLVLLLAAFGILSAGVAVQAEDDQEEILVGRITHVEGELLRYVEDDKDWVLTVKDAPFGLEDALYSGEKAKAEFIMPNWTWFRVGENTQLQLIALTTDATTMDVASGLARVYNKSDDAVVKVTTPFGYVVAPGGTAFDLYVGDESLEVIAVQGSVDFVHEGTEVKYEVEEGSSSIIANASEAGRGNGTVDSDWDDWNGKRDDIWMERLKRSESSAEFLPDPIRYESYALEENGRWERVYYEGEYRDMWRPTRIDPGWRPFTAGRWTVYYGDNCWIPDESFGYVTHHYGSWIYIESFRAWYWVPPAPRFAADTPRVFIGFGWYPGRVGWLHSGPSIGWVPLAPNEVYYGYRPWGRRTVIVKHNTVINITTVRYRFLDEAVIIDRDHFYRGSRYTPYVKRDIRRDDLINSYRPVTVINNTVINNFNSDKRRFAYNDEKVSRKPHASVVNRINDNEKSSRNFGRGNRERIKGDLARINTGSEPPSRSDIRSPMLATRLVDADKTGQPLDRLSSEQKEIKPRDRERQVRAGDGERRRPREQGRFDQPRDNAGQEEKRRLRSPRESRNEVSEQVSRQQDQIRPQEEGKGRERQQPPSPRMVRGKTQEELQQGQTAPPSDDQRRLKSPRDKGNREPEQGALQQDQGRPQKESQVRQEPKLSRQTPEEGGRRQEPEIRQRQEDEGKGREGQPPPSPKTVRGKQQEEPQQVLTPPPSDDQRRPKSPRDKGNREIEQSVPQQDQVRQQKENQVRQEQEVRRQQDEGKRRQEQEVQRQRGEEVKARQAAEQRAVQQDQVRQQKENQVRQEQEVRRQQEEGKRRQEQEVQQRRQQEQEVQRQRGEEVKARQAAEQRAVQQEQVRQQKENQVRQAQEARRQQEEGKRRQEQEVQQRQQQEQQQANQRRQEQEVQRRQQEAKQVQQRPEKQRQQPEAAPSPQGQQPQAAKNKSKKQLEEEERLLREQQSPKN